MNVDGRPERARRLFRGGTRSASKAMLLGERRLSLRTVRNKCWIGIPSAPWLPGQAKFASANTETSEGELTLQWRCLLEFPM